jgi:hypothetical protein
MRRIAQIAGSIAIALAASLPGIAGAAELDPKAVIYTLPDKFEFKPNPRNPLGAQQIVLQGDPTREGLYVVLTRWPKGQMSRPHWHPKDRFITVIKGTWWVGSGGTFAPDQTVPMPAGSYVTHFAKGVHYDGAKDEDAIILIVGEGPATNTPFVAGSSEPPRQ